MLHIDGLDTRKYPSMKTRSAERPQTGRHKRPSLRWSRVAEVGGGYNLNLWFENICLWSEHSGGADWDLDCIVYGLHKVYRVGRMCSCQFFISRSSPPQISSSNCGTSDMWHCICCRQIPALFAAMIVAHLRHPPPIKSTSFLSVTLMSMESSYNGSTIARYRRQ